MEIVKHGDTCKKYECMDCGCQFYASDADFEIPNLVLSCPECGNTIYCPNEISLTESEREGTDHEIKS